MGNIVSISLPSDPIFDSSCWGSLIQPPKYIRRLKKNLEALDHSFGELAALKADVLRKVEVAELQRSMKRLNQVQLWIEKVEKIENEVAEVKHGRVQEIQKLCCGAYCSKNYLSSYKYGKKVYKKLAEVDDLKNKGIFAEVAEETFPATLVRERPMEPTVGMEFVFYKVWSQLEDEQVGIIGLYGMGGVGKTTLLTQINNKLLHADFDLVIWIVVSKDHNVETVQDKIGDKIGFSSNSWKQKQQSDKAEHICRLLSKKKFALLFDDIWEPIEITKLGVPIPNPHNKSKIIFTTRSEDVCGQMDAHKKIKVECLAWDKAWNLFQEKVGRETLGIHPDIQRLAQTVAKECGGLPLALITVGRAMACKKTTQEWNHAIHILKKSAHEFSGMEDKVFRLLKFSYDNLADEKVRSCFLYCALYPEDFFIFKDDLVYLWMCEAMLDEYGSVEEAKNKCYDIIGTLVAACLLEVNLDMVKMHDMIRDMALWLARDCSKENDSFLVHTSAQAAPDVKKWKIATRVSLVDNHIESIVETPKSTQLLTLLIQGSYISRSPLNMIVDGFFDYMHKLRVLDLSRNEKLTQLPSGVSNLIALQHLNLSRTGIRELSIELKALVRLKYLNLEYTNQLNFVPPELISNFHMLKVLKLFGCSSSDRILFGGERALIEEIEGLKHLEVFTLCIRSSYCFKKLFSYNIIVTSTQYLHLSDGKNYSSVLDISSLADMKHLRGLRIDEYPNLEELEIYWAGQDPNDPRNAMMRNQSRFCGLEYVDVCRCPNLKDLTWLIFASNLRILEVRDCSGMEKIIDLERFGRMAGAVKEQNAFAKLTDLHLDSLPRLRSIYGNALPFLHLNQILVYECPALKKLPLNSTSAERCNLIIRGQKEWWNGLEWENEVSRSVFLPYFMLAFGEVVRTDFKETDLGQFSDHLLFFSARRKYILYKDL
ncbi:hypothetical protein ACFX13_045945 [Malus domestica]